MSLSYVNYKLNIRQKLVTDKKNNKKIRLENYASSYLVEREVERGTLYPIEKYNETVYVSPIEYPVKRLYYVKRKDEFVKRRRDRYIPK